MFPIMAEREIKEIGVSELRTKRNKCASEPTRSVRWRGTGKQACWDE